MKNITEIINTLNREDMTLWNKARNEMRRAYLTAHNLIIGVESWSHDDDTFTDYIDAVVVTLFERSGRLSQNASDHEVENDIRELVRSKSTNNAINEVREVQRENGAQPWKQ